MKEIWRPVLNYENLYRVSCYGRVRSLPRVSVDKLGRERRWPGQILKSRMQDDGYLYISLYRNGKFINKSVHNLVLTAFEGECPSGKEGAHNDGNKINNISTNLRWATPTENNQDKRIHGTHINGQKINTAKLNEDTVRRIRVAYARKRGTMEQLGKMYGIGKSAIRDVIKRKTWKHI